MIEKIALPSYAGFFGGVLFKFADALLHAHLPIKAQNAVKVVRHENQQMKPKISAILIKPQGLQNNLCRFFHTQLIFTPRRATDGYEIFRSIFNPDRNSVRQCFSLRKHAQMLKTGSARGKPKAGTTVLSRPIVGRDDCPSRPRVRRALRRDGGLRIVRPTRPGRDDCPQSSACTQGSSSGRRTKDIPPDQFRPASSLFPAAFHRFVIIQRARIVDNAGFGYFENAGGERSDKPVVVGYKQERIRKQ